MKHIINGREWRLSKTYLISTLWTSNYLCPDGDVVKLYVYKEELQLQCFSGIAVSFIIIDQIDFPYLPVKINYTEFLEVQRQSQKEEPDRLNRQDIKKVAFEVQCLHIADYFCRLFCTWKEN